MLIVTVVVITVIMSYTNNNDRRVYDAIQQTTSTTFEDKKSAANTKPDSITKTGQGNLTTTDPIARQSLAPIALTEIIEPESTVPADKATIATVEDDHAETAELIDNKALIADTLKCWSDAWSNQRVEEYLLFYHDDFQPAQNMKKQSWIKERWSRISRPAWIKVKITAMEIDRLDENLVRVIFKQHYESPNYRDTALKTIRMVKTGRQWKIISEESVTI